MSAKLVQIRTEKELRDQALAVFERIGLDIPTEVQMLFKASVRKQGIPFKTDVNNDTDLRKGSLVGMVLSNLDKNMAWNMERVLSAEGYTVFTNGKKDRLMIADYNPPVTMDSDGFFIENDALANRIRRELREEPYNREDRSVFPLLISDQQRGNNEDVIGFIPGLKRKDDYQPEYMYLPSKIFIYSNLRTCISKVISGFDIYGLDYVVSWKQWDEIKKTAMKHGRYASEVTGEIDNWLRKASSEVDPAMTIMCI